jgi:hypothetical protein
MHLKRATLTAMNTTLTKTCRRCNKTKGLDCFYPQPSNCDGLHHQCTACFAEYYRERYQRDPEAARAKARERYQKNKAKRAAYYLAAKQLHAKKLHARAEVKKALSRGDLVRKPCEVCGNPKSDAHHSNYDEPLRVDWLCRLHHAARHIEEKTAGREGGLRYGR